LELASPVIDIIIVNGRELPVLKSFAGLKCVISASIRVRVR
jgi:hypothetical protein